MDADRLDRDAAGVGALAEPVRRHLYRFVADAEGPVSREQAAQGVSVAVHTAKFHLDKLVDAELLEVEYRRLSGRSGPGAGRPAKLYRRTDRELEVSIPQRHYDLLGGILAAAVSESTGTGAPVAEVAARIARAEGQRLGSTTPARGSGPLERLASALAGCGYEPRVDDPKLVLRNCPFHRIAQEQTEIVCGLNLEYVTGVSQGLGSDVVTELEPWAGHCCVSATRR
jgi:predicted ArsR family transcriptional regulator